MTIPDLSDAALEEALESIRRGTPVELLRVRIREDQMSRMVAAAPESDGTPTLPRMDLSGSHIAGDPDLAGVRFSGDAVFTRAVFEASARFAEAQFAGEARFGRVMVAEDARFTGAAFSAAARFDHAEVEGNAEFGEVVFGGDAAFNDATVGGESQFGKAAFEEDARFNDATFCGDAWFGEARFAADVWFDGATFEADAWFGGVRFCRDAWLGDTVFGGGATFLRAVFEQARDIGPILAAEMLTFQGADFHAPVRIKAAARRASWEDARFRSGGDLSLRWAEVTLQRAEFGGPSILTTLPPSKAEDALGREWLSPGGVWQCMRDKDVASGSVPALVSLREAKLADLSLSEVDLRRCVFNGARGLSSLQLERVRFAESPTTYSLHWPWRWTRRQTIAEEHHWREGETARGWGGPDTRAPDWVPAVADPPTAEQLAAIYRALRKGREDIKDEPGAADFYYGEMEMRRQSPGKLGGGPGFAARPTPPVERWLVGLYWLVSGYALRSSRALATLAIVLLLFAALFELFGFESTGVQTRVSGVSADGGLVYERVKSSSETVPETALDALTFSAATAASVLSTTPSRPLTRAGEVLRIVLRIVGPILIGLALLSFRGRVKR